MKHTISVVVPIYNEEDNIAALHAEIKQVCEANGYTYEIIFIDDGSSDKSNEIALTLSPLRHIRFRKNFGQTAAMDAGIKTSQHELIVTMDGDRQNDPEDIPRLIQYLNENDLDVVSGWRVKRKDTFSKRFVSRVANMLRKILIDDGIHDSGCSLKVYRKECFEELNLYGEMHRFIPALLKIKGFKVGELEVNHRPRVAGVTKYNWKRSVKGFIDMLSVWFWNKYSVRPLHFLGSLGLSIFFLGILASFYSLYYYVSVGKVGHTAWPILSAFLLIIGLILFVLGLISDILIKSYFETTRNRSYTIKKITDNR